MDVTCDRCHTEYEFDDALVSEQGTSVRCTQCGFKFRVKKQGGAAAPEIWVVRTVDGRELEFRAIRDLKTAISAGRISRDDVLSRGVGRPRRLASIAELEPFFTGHAQLKSNTVIGLGDEPRPRSRTPQGLGPPMLTEDSHPGRDNSVAIPLPSSSQSEVTRQYPRELAQDLSKLEDDAIQASAHTTQPFGTPAAVRVRPNDDMPTPAHGTPALVGATRPRSSPAIHLPKTPPPPSADPVLPEPPLTERDPLSVEPETARKVREPATPPPPPLPPPAAPPARPEPSAPPPRAVDAFGSTQLDQQKSDQQKQVPVSKSEAAKSNGTPAPADVAPPSAGVSPTSQRQALMPPVSEVEPSTTRKPVDNRSTENRNQPSERPPAVKVSEKPAPGASEPPPEVRANRDSLDSIPPEPGVRRGSQTPTPADVRYSISGEDSNIVSDPRISSAATSRSSGGATRLIVGVLVAGALAFALVLAVQRFVLKPTNKVDAAGDQRLATFLSEGEKALADGDLDAAKEQLDKASALGDADPRVAKSLARLANARADVPWLKLRLLAADDPDRDATKREYADAAERARKAVEKAHSLAPTDGEIVRTEVDQKRLVGDVSGARKLVEQMSSVSGQPESVLVLGALDLAEESPPWPSVIERLSKAASDEGSIGRARSLLVYALAMSGDPKRARTELARLTALPRPHPLAGALKKFLDRIDKGETPPLRVDDLPSLLPSAAGSGDPSSSGGEVPGGTSNAMKQALDARSHGDLRRAENLYQSVIDRDPNNSEALSGLASIARSQGSVGRAIGLYQRVVDHNPNYVPAIMSLADMKWDAGDRGAASALYARAVELGAGDARAKERAQGGGGPTTPPPETSTSSSTGGAVPKPDPDQGSTSGSPPPDPTPPPPPGDTPKEGTP